MTAAAKTIKYNGPKTNEHIERHSRRSADSLLEEIRYNAQNPEYEAADILPLLLRQYIEIELLGQNDKGVVSLAERVNCPLMWSHYGDQHRGLCIGYSVPEDATSTLHQVEYGGSRLVEASKIASMLNGNDDARQAVDKAVLLRKAADWAYEREWRFIGARGLQGSRLELEEIVFGLRCSTAVTFAVIKALQDRDRLVRFFEMKEVRGTFELVKQEVETDEMMAQLPRRYRFLYDGFKPGE